MRLHICGVRGSTPAPGADFVRYGGHTSCIAVAPDGASPPTLIVDAGTGLRRVTPLLGGNPFVGTILLGHLHWDHTHGLPFFRGGDDPDSKVDVYLPAQGPAGLPADAEAVLAQGMSPPNFPVRPSELRGQWRFHGLDPGVHEIENFSVLAMEIPHKGGRTFGYRISNGAVSFAYLSDHHPLSKGAGPEGFGEYHDVARTLTQGVDLLIHDAQYTAEEFPGRAHFGHSTVDYVIGLGQVSEAKRVLLFHHDPARTDDEMDSLMTDLVKRLPGLEAAREGQIIDLI